MKKTGMADAILLIFIIALILVVIFFGILVFSLAQPPRSSDVKPLPSGATTLWEKAEWEKYHGNVYQCGYFAEAAGPVVFFPSANATISRVSTRFALTPGEPPHDITGITYTLSTEYAMKTVRYDDPSVNLTRIVRNGAATTIQKKSRNNLLERDESISVELDTEKMGFTSSAFGPNQRFVLAITPPEQCFRGLKIQGTTPAGFSPEIPMEVIPE
ncbi:MAG: hypothetical protein WC626_10800 [Methanoregula sp.]